MIWFWMIFCLASDKGGASSSRLAKQLGMHQATVWNFLQKLKHAMSRRDENISLAGFIELDEAIIGLMPEKKADLVVRMRLKSSLNERAWDVVEIPNQKKIQTEVLVLVEGERFHAGNLVMSVVFKTTRDAIREVVQERVEDNRQIFKTDAFQAHYVLKSCKH